MEFALYSLLRVSSSVIYTPTGMGFEGYSGQTIYQMDRYLRISLMSAMNIISYLMAIKSF
jgi:hypothetical protein